MFVTSAKNVKNNNMTDAPKKHVGILSAGVVYKYTHATEQVRKDDSVEAFHKRMSEAYKSDGKDISLYYGVPL